MTKEERLIESYKEIVRKRRASEDVLMDEVFEYTDKYVALCEAIKTAKENGGEHPENGTIALDLEDWQRILAAMGEDQ